MYKCNSIGIMKWCEKSAKDLADRTGKEMPGNLEPEFIGSKGSGDDKLILWYNPWQLDFAIETNGEPIFGYEPEFAEMVDYGEDGVPLLK